MKDLGEATYILGIRIYRDISRKLLGLSQSMYTDKMLKSLAWISPRKVLFTWWIMNGWAFVWKSSKQDNYWGRVHSSFQWKWFGSINSLDKLGVVPSIVDLILLYWDNNGAIAQAKEPQSHQISKHVLTLYHLILEIIGRQDVKIERVPTDQNIADPLTKALHQGKFDQHVNAMGIRYMGDWL